MSDRSVCSEEERRTRFAREGYRYVPMVPARYEAEL